MRHALSTLFAGSLLLAACGSPAPACRKGDTRACLGPAACMGAQVCLADESGFGSCDCGGAGGGAGGGSAGGTSGGTAGGVGGGFAGGFATAGGAGGGIAGGFATAGGDGGGSGFAGGGMAGGATAGGASGGVAGGTAGGVAPRGTADFTLIGFSGFRGSVETTRINYSPDAAVPDSGVLDAGGGFVTAEFAGLHGLAGWIALNRASSPNPIVVTAGDVIGGGQTTNVLNDDAPALAALNHLGLEVTTFGESDFGRGVSTLRSRMGDGGFTWVTSNLVNSTTELPQAAQGFTIIPVGVASPQVNVAFIGINGPDLPASVGPGKLGALTVADPLTAARTAARAARDAGADVVVALAHIGITGFDMVGMPVGPLVTFAAAASSDVDVIIGDHSDYAFSTSIGGALVVQGRRWGQTLHKVSVSVVAGQVTSKTATSVITNTFNLADAGADALLAPYRAAVTGKFDQRIGVTTTRFAQNSQHERLGETNLGNLVGDAMLDRYRQSHGVQIAFTNGGGLRQPLLSSYVPTAGGFVRLGMGALDVLVADPYYILPFGNACTIRLVTGQVLWSVLEHSVAVLPARDARLLQIAGMQFDYDVARLPGSRVLAVRVCLGGHGNATDGGIGRECLVPVDVPSNDQTVYVAVTNDFTSGGGDGYAMLAPGDPPSLRLESVAEVLTEYVKTHTPVVLPCPSITTPCGLSSATPGLVCNSVLDQASVGSTCRSRRQ